VVTGTEEVTGGIVSAGDIDFLQGIYVRFQP
jgi:hypothetical protein